MKTYTEMAQSILERRDQYFAQQKKRRQMAMRIGIPSLCAVAVALIAVFMLFNPSDDPLTNPNASPVQSQPAIQSQQTSTPNDNSDPHAVQSSNPSSDASSGVTTEPESETPSKPSKEESAPTSSLPSSSRPAQAGSSTPNSTVTQTPSRPEVIWVPDYAWASPDHYSPPESPKTDDPDPGTLPGGEEPGGSDEPAEPGAAPDEPLDVVAPTDEPGEEPSYEPAAPYTTEFNRFEQFEEWLVCGYTPDNSPRAYTENDIYVVNTTWYYMWKGADTTLKTGYYIRPASGLTSGGWVLSYIWVPLHSDHSTLLQYYCLNEFSEVTIVGCNNSFVLDQLRQRRASTNATIMEENGIQYEIYSLASHNNYCSDEIYWEQDGYWFRARWIYYRSNSSARWDTMLPKLQMEKVYFRK